MAERSSSAEELYRGLEGLSVYGRRKKEKFKKTSTTSSDNSSYLGDLVDNFPSSTSKWNIFCLESLGIFYNKTYHDSPQDILNMIFEETGAFRPLSEEQLSTASDIKNSITFNFPIDEITNMLVDNTKAVLNNGETFFPEIEEDFVKCQSVDIREFLLSCQLMLSCRAAFYYDFRENIEPEDMFVKMLEKFSRLCQLIPVPGSAKKTTMTLQNVSVLSTADLVMIPERYRLSAFSAMQSTTYMYVVSIVEIQNLHRSKSQEKEEKVARYMRSSAEAGVKDCYETPHIYSKVHTDVLAQHGGELLIHRQLYSVYSSTLSSNIVELHLPGMVVVGTEVIFTVMKIHRQHIQQLKEQIDPTFTATIYYSKPKDLLRKEDRDQLVEAFTRLTNI